MNAQEIEVDIDELVFVGFEALDQNAVADAFRQELGELILDRGIVSVRPPSATRETESPVTMMLRPTRPAGIGQQIAKAVFDQKIAGTLHEGSRK